MVIDRSKIVSVHHIRYMMCRNTPPVCNTRCAVFISTGVTAIRISLSMSDQNSYIRIIDILIHQDSVSPLCAAKIHQMFIIFAVMTDNLMRMKKLMK